MPKTDYSNFTTPELIATAKERGIKVTRGMTRAALIEALQNLYGVSPEEATERLIEDMAPGGRIDRATADVDTTEDGEIDEALKTGLIAAYESGEPTIIENGEIKVGSGYLKDVVAYLSKARASKDDTRTFLRLFRVSDGVIWVTDGKRIHFTEAEYLPDGCYDLRGKGTDSRLVPCKDTMPKSQTLTTLFLSFAYQFSFETMCEGYPTQEQSITLKKAWEILDRLTGGEWVIDIGYWQDAIFHSWDSRTDFEVYYLRTSNGYPGICLLGTPYMFRGAGKVRPKLTEVVRRGSWGMFGAIILPIRLFSEA